jgi:hypothetical protein
MMRPSIPPTPPVSATVLTVNGVHPAPETIILKDMVENADIVSHEYVY